MVVLDVLMTSSFGGVDDERGLANHQKVMPMGATTNIAAICATDLAVASAWDEETGVLRNAKAKVVRLKKKLIHSRCEFFYFFTSYDLF
jgi:hypothetical protein